MLNAKAFANAATAVTAFFYVVCLLVSYVAPDFVRSVASSWMHSISLEGFKTNTGLDLVSAVWGLVTISVITWATSYAVIWLYNKLK